jgi:CDP-diacylglycerol--glycerol-3-phosphate 3-phosphatidyltransferase
LIVDARNANLIAHADASAWSRLIPVIPAWAGRMIARGNMNLPNQITVARLLMAVVFFVLLAQFEIQAEPPDRFLLDVCAGLFIVAALSDMLDGYLARKHNQVTSLGRVLDPFVDKILTLGAYIFLAGDGFVDAQGRMVSDIWPWMVVVILGRELLVTSLRGATEATGQAFGANVYGKLKMFLQSVAVVWVLLTVAHPAGLSLFVYLRPWVVYLTVLVTVLSLFPYLRAGRSVLSQKPVTNA